MAPTRPPVQELAAPFGGVVTQAALVAAGYHPAKAHDLVERGRWRRLLPGIYLTAATEPTLRQRCQAAQLHAGSTAVITGTAGCLLRGIPAPGASGEVTVVVDAGAHPVRAAFCHVVRARVVPDHQLLRREGQSDLRVALPDRCVADALRRAPDHAGAIAIGAAAMRHPSVSWDLVAAERRSGPGTGSFTRAMRDLDDGVRSPAESDVHTVLLRAARRRRLPPYLLNPELYVDGVFVGSPDAWFPGFGLGDEVDSREWHGGTDELDATLLRHERFGTHGLALCHVTPARFAQDPQAHVSTLRTQLAKRRALAVREPAGLVVLARGPLLPARTAWPQLVSQRWR